MIKLRDARLYSRRFPLRRPFRFGIVELNELEHLVIAATFVIDGQTIEGFAGENLVPRWFVKDPSQSIETEIASMRHAIRAVADAAANLPGASSPFDLWWQLHRFVRERSPVTPPLLAQLAESLIERAAIDAWGRFHRLTFAGLLHANKLGINLAHVHGCFRGAETRLFDKPATHLVVRHTVGLADDLDELSGIVRNVGIHRLKMKLAGNADADARRIIDVTDACEKARWSLDRITLDGNENYKTVAEFEKLTASLARDAGLRVAAERIAWIEQPFHRAIALTDEVGVFLGRGQTPPMIIDESDSSPDDLPRALKLGYAGTTHKNCKGVFNSIVHRALLSGHAAETGKPTIFSGEDLTIVAPWSQASDLVVAAAVGVIDVERNGQHFANGLVGFGAAVSEQAVRDFPALYRRRDDGIVELRIVDGRIQIPTTIPSAPALDLFDELAD